MSPDPFYSPSIQQKIIVAELQPRAHQVRPGKEQASGTVCPNRHHQSKKRFLISFLSLFYLGASLFHYVEPPSADQHAEVVWGGSPATAALTRFCGLRRANALQRSADESVLAGSF